MPEPGCQMSDAALAKAKESETCRVEASRKGASVAVVADARESWAKAAMDFMLVSLVYII